MAFKTGLTYTLAPASEQNATWIYDLYESTMRPVIEEAIGWIDADQRARFSKRYIISNFQLISIKDALAGALYTIQKSNHLHLSLILIQAQFRNRSVGTKIIQDIHSNQLSPIKLSVFKNNPAVNLYKRLEYKIINEDDWFYEMTWTPNISG
jgi:predicted acetyltransferase